MAFIRTFVFLLAVGALAACGEPTKQDIIKDADGADTKAKLESALGEPTEVFHTDVGGRYKRGEPAVLEAVPAWVSENLAP